MKVKHLTPEQKRAYDKERYYWYMANRICVNCRKERAARGHTKCANCLDDAKETNKKRNAAMSDKQKEAESKRKKEYQERLYRERRCGRCTKPLEPWSPYKTCQRCRARCRIKNAEYRVKQGAIPAVLRNSKDYCSVCSKPIDASNGKKICDRCYDNCLKNLEKANQNRNNDYFRRLNNIFWEEKKALSKTPSA